MDLEKLSAAILIGAVALMLGLLVREIRKANRNYEETMRERRRK